MTPGRLAVSIQAADNGQDIINQGEISERVYNAFGQVEQTIRYASRIDTTGLSGGLITPALRTQLDSLRDTANDSLTQSELHRARGRGRGHRRRGLCHA